MAEEKRVRPFHAGTQYLTWENANCCRCEKYSDDASACDLMYALAVACLDDGTVSDDVARRIGYIEGPPFYYCWMCSEVKWTDEWIAEVNAQSGED